MADNSTGDRILNLLKGKTKRTETLAKIVQTLRLPKKSVNIELYKLQRSGVVVKVQDTPPVWSLNVSGNSLLSLSTGSAIKERRDRTPKIEQVKCLKLNFNQNVKG